MDISRRLVDYVRKVHGEERDPSYHEAIGHTNPDFNGAAFDAAIESMVEEKEKTERVNEAPLATPATDTPRKRLTKKALRALGPEITDKDAVLYNAVMDEHAKVIINSSKDVVMAGESRPGGHGPMMDWFIKLGQNFATSMKSMATAYEHDEIGKYISSVAHSFKVGSFKASKSLLEAISRTQWAIGAKYEATFRALGMPEWAEFVNSLYAAGKMVHKVLDQVPQVYNMLTGEWDAIPGGLSFRSIMAEFGDGVKAMWNSGHDKQVQGRSMFQFHQQAMRDLDLYLVSQRQIEIDARAKTLTATLMPLYNRAMKVWKDAEAVSKGSGGEKPKRPDIPNVNPDTTMRSIHVIEIMKGRYGKDIAIFEKAAIDFSKWQNTAVLAKLFDAGFISEKAYNDMLAAGERYIPLRKLKNALNEGGVLNVRLDESMYKVVDYLKNDTTASVESPINAGVKRAKAVELLTYRQQGRNALGRAILKKFDVGKGKDIPLHILTTEEEVTEKVYKKLPAERKKSVTKRSKNADGSITETTTYYSIQPMRGEAAEQFIKDLKAKVISQSKHKKTGAVTDEQAQSNIERHIVSFYPEGEKGNPMYLWISDGEVANSIYGMNNPQVVFFNSITEKVLGYFENQVKSSEGASRMASQIAYQALRGVFGFNKVAKRAVTGTMQFVFNSPFRDIPQALVKSRHGLTLKDWLWGVKESALLLFPSMREMDPNTHWLSEDASKGTGSFATLIGMDLKDVGEASFLSWSGIGRKALEDEVRAGVPGARQKLMWRDLRAWAASEGAPRTPLDVIKQAKDGTLKDKLISPFLFSKSVYDGFVMPMRMLGNISENSFRIAERNNAMAVDLSDPKYARLRKFYPNIDKASQQRAGFSAQRFDRSTGEAATSVVGQFMGRSHRAQWAIEEERMAADPNYIPPLHTLPIKYTAAERDWSMAHVTTNFSQRGTASHTMESVHMFWNPAQQDTASVFAMFAKTSAVRKALNAWGRENPGIKVEPLVNQHLYDAHALGWLLKNFAFMTLPAIASAMMYSGDDEEDKKWQAQSFIEKLSYWHVPIPGTGVTMRLASGIGFANLLFKDLPMAAWIQMAGQDPKGMSKWADRFFDATLMGNVINVAKFPYSVLRGTNDPQGLVGVGGRAAGSVFSSEFINPAVELWGNREEFRDRPIASANMQGLPSPEVNRDKYNALTNRLATAWNSQPAQVAYALKRYFPGTLGILPWTVNKVMEGAGAVGAIDTADSMPSNSPLSGQVQKAYGIQATPREPWGYSNESVQDVLRLYREAESQRKAYDNMVESRKPGYLKDHPLIDDSIYYPLRDMSDDIKMWEDNAKFILSGQDPEYADADRDIRMKKAMDIRRMYTLQALELARKATLISLAGE